jgi:protein involved in polysaccharide export with SLBB domain
MKLRYSLQWIPLLSILAFQSLPSQNIRISKGDILEIRVYSHDELSKNVQVEADGTVEYPLITNIPIDGLSLDEFRQMLSLQITKSLNENPIVTVRFSQSIMVSVTVLGQVMAPGEYQVLKISTVQGAIARAGGATPRAQLDSIRVLRKVNGVKTVIPVNLFRFYVQGDPDLLPNLEDGDMVIVPGMPGTNDVKVVGEVRSPGSYPVYQGANVLDVLLMAGGPSKDAALNRVRLISPRLRESRGIRVNLEILLKGEHAEPAPGVRPGDIIFVPNRQTIWRSGLSLLRDVVAIASPIALILYYSGAVRR